jgi:hypothetical protein
MCVATNVRLLNGRTLGDNVGKYTCYKNGTSTIDYGMVDQNCYNDICFFKVNDLHRHLSDHCSLSIMLKAEFTIQKENNKCKTFKLPAQFKWDNSSHELFRKSLENDNIKNMINDYMTKDMTDSNVATDACTDIFQKVATLSLKKRLRNTKTHFKKKWFDKELLDTRNELRKQCKKLNSLSTPSIQDSQCVKYLSKLYKSMCKRKYREYKNSLVDKIEKINMVDSKQGWQALEELNGKYTLPQNDNIDKENWLNHYKNLNTLKQKFEGKRDEYKLKLEKLENEMLLKDPIEELNKTITMPELEKAITEIKNNKAGGNDLIINEMLKVKHPEIKMMIYKLFNIILNSGKYPTKWGIGNITSLFKGGDTDNTNNFRGTTITSSLGKLFNRILNNRLECFRNNSNLKRKEQIAYEKGKRTTDHLFTLYTLLEKYNTSKNNMYACFIDMRKAFDTVIHESVLLKLLNTNVNGNFYKLIKSMYENVNLSVKINPTERTEYFKSQVGIRQGDNLSPNLFKIILNDLPYTLEESEVDPVSLNGNHITCLMYADDLVLFSESAEGLQNSINKTVNYCYEHGLEVNISKTKTMQVNKRTNTFHEFKIGEEKIENVNHYKYLGLTFDQNGTLHKARSQLYGSALKAMHKLRKCIGQSNISIRTALRLFDSLISPILLYGCELTNTYFFNHNKSIDIFLEKILKTDQEKLHLNFCRMILGVNNKTANVAVLGELGRMPIFIKGFKFAVNFFNRAIRSEEDSLLKFAIEESKTKQNSNKCWSNWLHKILSAIHGQNFQLENEILYSNHSFNEKFIDFWKRKLFNDQRIEGGNKLRTYRLFKSNHTMEKYLHIIKNKNHRQALTKLRVSNHKLRIETGRYTGTAIDQRVCDVCQTLEDEKHFLILCKKFEKERKPLFENIKTICINFDHLSEEEKLVYIMTIEDELILKELSKFVYENFKKL